MKNNMLHIINTWKVLNLIFGTYFIYLLFDKCTKYIARSDHDGVPYFTNLSKTSKLFIRLSNLITSFALCNAILIHIDSRTINELIMHLAIFSANYISRLDPRIVTESVVLFTCIFHLYKFLYFTMNKNVIPFQKIDPEHKKMYVIKNFVKSVMLACLCTVIFDEFWNIIDGNIDLYLMKRCAIYYVINDIVGLLIVEKLPKTTKIHHTVTTLCALFTQYKIGQELDLITLIIIYASFSSLAFCVNFYLGFRIFEGHEKTKKILSISSFWVYVITCIINWAVQMSLAVVLFKGCLFQLFEYSMNFTTCIINNSMHDCKFNMDLDYTLLSHFFLYVAFFTAVSKDDVVLMKWLYKDHNDFKQKLFESSTNNLPDGRLTIVKMIDGCWYAWIALKQIVKGTKR